MFNYYTISQFRGPATGLPADRAISRSYILGSTLSGLLLALAYPNFNLWWLAWIALVPFFYFLYKVKGWKQAGWCGFVFGVTFFSINLFWITTLFRFVGWWAVVGWVCLTVFQSIFISLFSIFYALFSNKQTNRLTNFLVLPTLWTITEILRAWGPFGLPSGVVGYTQASFLPLIQIASFTTVYGVSFIVVMVNAALTPGPSPKGRGGVRTLFIVILLITIVIAYGDTTIRHSSLVISHFPKLALIQPNIDQMDKMDPRKVNEIFNIHEELTRQATKEQPAIIIWPETAIFSYLLRDPALLPRIQSLAKESEAWLIIGTPHYTVDGNAYNSLVSISPSGEVVSRYDKQRLVPFGEYLPFKPLLYPFLKGTGFFDQGFDVNGNISPVIAGNYQIAAAICFESTFPDTIKARVGEKTDFILTVTNDGWFGSSSAPYFHFNHGIFRAIENRKYFIQVGNTGISGVIDPYGRVLRRSTLGKRQVLIYN
ncbi:MAG: apolipoprotein N-acyltransferase [bacterium]